MHNCVSSSKTGDVRLHNAISARMSKYVCVSQASLCGADGLLMMLLCYRVAYSNTHVCTQKKQQHAILVMKASREQPVSKMSTEESVLTRRDLRLLDCNGKQVIELLLSVCLGFLLVLCRSRC